MEKTEAEGARVFFSGAGRTETKLLRGVHFLVA
jgi:hypothetical protein